MKQLFILTILLILFGSCEKRQGCEVDNTGQFTIQNLSNNSTIWIYLEHPNGNVEYIDSIEGSNQITIQRPATTYNIVGRNYNHDILWNKNQFSLLQCDDSTISIEGCEMNNTSYFQITGNAPWGNSAFWVDFINGAGEVIINNFQVSDDTYSDWIELPTEDYTAIAYTCLTLEWDSFGSRTLTNIMDCDSTLLEFR